MRPASFSLLLFALSLALNPAHAAPVARATVAPGKLQIDGRLDETGWSITEWQTGFVSASESAAAAGAPRPAAVQTRFKVLYDSLWVYVGVECDEPLIDQLVGQYHQHDQDVYADDCVELFFDPAGEGRYYHHFVININGAWYDDHNADYGLAHAKLWDCPLRTGVTVDTAAHCWRLEVALPLAGLQLGPDAGASWLWNVARERQAGGHLELTTWSPLKGNFHLPRLFGRLEAVAVDYDRFRVTLDAPQTAVGEGSGESRELQLRVPVSNPGPAPRRLVLAAEHFLQPQTRVQAAAFELGAGATALIALPALTTPRDAAEASIQLTLSDAANGAPVKMAVKRIATEYRPLAISLMEPVYRGNIHATESVPQIRFRVSLTDETAARSRTLSYVLTDSAGHPVAGTAGSLTMARLDQPLAIPAAALPVGRYLLSAQAMDETGTIVARAAAQVRRLGPAPGVEVRADGRGNILVDGRPRLFIGWYGEVPFDDPRPEVVALQNIVTPVVLSGVSPADLQELRDRFTRHGIYSVVSIEPGRLFSTFRLWEQPGGKELSEEIKHLKAPSPAMRELLARLVAAVAAEPGVLGYYLADEPEINNARAEYLEAVYTLMQELDPYRPLMITNDTLDGIVTHGYRACDILSPDPYSPEPGYLPAFMRRCREVLRPGQALMLTPWTASGQTHFDQVMGSNPPYPYAVMRYQWLTGLAMGARGYTGYTSSFFLPEPQLRYGLPAIWRELRFLEPAAAEPQTPPTTQADAELITWLGRADGQLYLIAANDHPGARQATLSHPLLEGIATLDVLSEGRSVAVQGGHFSDGFAEGAVHVYTTDPAGRTLPTTAEVAALIGQQEKACIKPGNLLHWSRGVVARSGPGFYAPWFEQFFYGAINGVEDDQGWWLSHTDQPCELELELPQAEWVGRVELKVAHLRDYDLQLVDPDGKAQVAQIRGNEATFAAHRFAAPVQVVRLKVRVLAATQGPGTRNAQVREIEAYGEVGAGPTTPLVRAD
ncbi:MAG: carbohydrate-binding family 9-like protein [Candidatus Latescibacteria bacterium]|nr:carbohydrate-binding family 9-like protein [Candidatus Latescibacterota bacterium]